MEFSKNTRYFVVLNTEYMQSGNSRFLASSKPTEKIAQAGEVVGVHAHPLSLYLQSCSVRSRADTLSLFHLYPYVLCGSE
jgi:hypothetical protein